MWWNVASNQHFRFDDTSFGKSLNNGFIFMQVFLSLFLIFCTAETSPETREEMTQSREKEKRKQKEKTKKINKTTRNLVSGYYPEMRFFY